MWAAQPIEGLGACFPRKYFLFVNSILVHSETNITLIGIILRIIRVN